MSDWFDWRRHMPALASRLKMPDVLIGVAASLALAIVACVVLAVLSNDHAPPPVAQADAPPVQQPPPAPSPPVSTANSPVPSPAAASDPSPATARPAPTAEPVRPDPPSDWAALSIDEVRLRANAKDTSAMEEMGRRLIQGMGVAKDPQAGAGWLLRAAELGSAQSAFNVGVMYERGFVVERDSSRAVEWYRKAADANLAVAKHNLALLLRDGKGAPRDGKAAIELLRSASRQGMAASMFVLGDIYERGDAATADTAVALAWFAVTAEFDRQANRGTETALVQSALQRSQALQRTLTPAELTRAQELAQEEFKRIVEALVPRPLPLPAPEVAAAGPTAGSPPFLEPETPAWPKSTADQVRAIQEVLVQLKLLRARPDGALGAQTRAAIRKFQRDAGFRETGEPTREIFTAMRAALGRRDTVENSPLPRPPTTEPPPPEPRPEPAKPEAAALKPAPAPPPPSIDLGPPQPAPSPPTSADIALATPPAPISKPAPKIDPPKPPMPPIVTEKPEIRRIDLPPPRKVEVASAEAPPPPSATDFARNEPRVEPPVAPPQSEPVREPTAPPKTAPVSPPVKPGPTWPSSRLDQVKAIQAALRDLRFYRGTPDGKLGATTRNAIRDYERMAGLKETGEPSKAVFESLKEMRSLMKR